MGRGLKDRGRRTTLRLLFDRTVLDTRALAEGHINGAAGDAADEAFKGTLTDDPFHGITIKPFAAHGQVGGVAFLPTLQGFERRFPDEALDGALGQAVSDFFPDTTEDAVHAGQCICRAEACPDQDLIKVLPVVGLGLLRTGLGFIRRNAAVEENLFGFIVDSGLDRACLYGGTCSARSQSACHRTKFCGF